MPNRLALAGAVFIAIAELLGPERASAPAAHEPAANLWEVYSVGPQSSPDRANWRTELNRPLAN